ncbi:MAG: hypothetical protein JXR49_14845 [Acidobacteria bacterium]|nr:hypothetical protein [Acidobacteriota bacterium]
MKTLSQNTFKEIQRTKAPMLYSSLLLFYLLTIHTKVFCQCPEFVRFVPDTILNDGVSSTRLEVKTAPGTTSVILPVEDSRFVFGNRSVCGEQAEIALRDDGQEGDQLANDGIFTLGGIRWDTDPQHSHCVKYANGLPLSGIWEGFTQAFFNTIVLSDGSQTLTLDYEWGSFNVLDAGSIIAPDPIDQIAPDIQISSHVINIKANDFSIDENALVRRLYDFIADDYDQLTIVWPFLPRQEDSCGCSREPGGLHYHISSSVQGIGLDLYDRSADWGSSGRLVGWNRFLKWSEIHEGLIFHEFMHQWGAYFDSELGIISTNPGHFSDLTNISSWIGGCRWNDNGDGTFTNIGGTDGVGNFGLYLMGLIPASEVKPIYIAPEEEDANCGRQRLVQGPINKLTIDEIIDIYGLRIPGPENSQKKFNVAYAVISVGRLLNPWEMTFYNRMSQFHAGLLPKINGLPNSLYYYTGGRATLDTQVRLKTPDPVICLSRTEYEFSTVNGSPDPDPQPLVITNCGGGMLDWNISTDAPWLNVSTSKVELGQIDPPLIVGVDTTDLSPGIYASVIRIDALSQEMTIPVHLTIEPARLSIERVVNGASLQIPVGFLAYHPYAKKFWTSTIAPDSIARIYVSNLDNSDQNVRVKFIDGVDGHESEAQVFGVDSISVDVLVPGFFQLAQIEVIDSSGTSDYFPIAIVANGPAPGIFSANQNGIGPAKAEYQHVNKNGEITEGLTYRPDGQGAFKTNPIDLGTEEDEVYLTFYGTGFRYGWPDWGLPTAVIDNVWVPVVELDAHDTDPGVDYIVIGPIPRTLAGRKNVDAVFTFWNGRTSTNPVKVSFTGKNAEIIIDFGPGTGLWIKYNDAVWAKRHSLNPGIIAVADLDGNGLDESIVDFGASYGIWALYNNTAWLKLHSLSAEIIITGDLDGNGKDDCIIDFGSGIGIWVRYNNSNWTKLHNLSPETITTGDLDGNEFEDIVVDFGPGVGIYVLYNNTKWTKLHNLSPQIIATADLDDSGQDDCIIDFGPGVGIWIRYDNATWTKLHSLSAEIIATADLDDSGQDDCIIDFGPGIGIWIRYNNATWTKLHSLGAEIIATADLDDSGQDDCIIDFGSGVGIWIRYNNTSWVKLHSLSPESIHTGDLDNN